MKSYTHKNALKTVSMNTLHTENSYSHTITTSLKHIYEKSWHLEKHLDNGYQNETKPLVPVFTRFATSLPPTLYLYTITTKTTSPTTHIFKVVTQQSKQTNSTEIEREKTKIKRNVHVNTNVHVCIIVFDAMHSQMMSTKCKETAITPLSLASHPMS